METTIVYWGSIGRMEKTMETTRMGVIMYGFVTANFEDYVALDRLSIVPGSQC